MCTLLWRPVSPFPPRCASLNLPSLPTVMALSNGQVVDSFEGVPQRQQLQDFFQTLMDEANKALGPVGVATKHYEQMVTVRRGCGFAWWARCVLLRIAWRGRGSCAVKPDV